ncbi:MAG: RNA methyltransferase [Treponema sp.]|nr:RNA methyltransferase [Treponema sp.]
MKNKQRNELAVCGMAAVKKLEKKHNDRIQRLYFSEKVAPLFGGLCKTLAKNKKPYNQVKDEKELEKLAGTVHHQGVVAMIDFPELTQIDSDIIQSWVENKEDAVLLDHIGNANNFGAIVRSAVFFGIKNIIIPMDEGQTFITTSSYRVAEGGMEYVNIYTVANPEKLLGALNGKMCKVGTSLKAKKDVSQIRKSAGDKPVLIILGNEENGISREVEKLCDELVIIPFSGMAEGFKEPLVESLNVAQAASVIFYEIMK